VLYKSGRRSTALSVCRHIRTFCGVHIGVLLTGSKPDGAKLADCQEIELKGLGGVRDRGQDPELGGSVSYAEHRRENVLAHLVLGLDQNKSLASSVAPLAPS